MYIHVDVDVNNESLCYIQPRLSFILRSAIRFVINNWHKRIGLNAIYNAVERSILWYPDSRHAILLLYTSALAKIESR